MRQTPPVRHAPDRNPPGRTPWLRRVAALAGFALLPGLLTPAAYAVTGGTDPLGRPKLDAPRAQRVSPFTAQVNRKTAAEVQKAAAGDRTAAQRAREDQARPTTWPTAGHARLTLPATGKGGAARTTNAAAGSLPVTLSAPTAGKKAAPAAGPVTVEVLDQQTAQRLGIKGVALKVTGPRGGGSARLGMDYGKFAAAYGGDWAGRLRVLRLPDCALTDPTASKCHRVLPVPSGNERADENVWADLTFPKATTATAVPSARTATATGGRTMLLAVTAASGATAGGGDFKATPLSASSTWEAGGSSGTFTWSYPLKSPNPAGGKGPELSLSYDSGSVDGRTATTNNQGTQVGEGFDLTSSYVERKYGSCDDDGHDGKYDQCWKYDNASLVLGGKATELVKDDTTGEWRLKSDDASKVTHSAGADNGDDNGEYWTVVAGDGTKYVFGLNKLDGAADGVRTNSVWTAPVFGDDEGEPGYSDGTAFAGRDKKQAWRWNLDYVEDTHGNAMSYWYTAETNNYDKLGDDNTGTPYVRGGYLKEIRYGQRAGALFSAAPQASNKITFGYAERCLASGTGCDALTKDTRDNWPDVPFDAVCKDGDKCTYNLSPTFFTRKRLTTVTTYAWNAAATTPAFEAVDGWALKQLYLDPGDTGDSADQSLWLDEIKHTGKHGGDLSLDPVRFDHVFLPNRVDSPSDDILPLNRPRLKTITSETGAQTIVDYLPADCTAGQTMPKADENTKRCYPVYWSPNGEKVPVLDWFQKYPVSAVRTTDPLGGSEAVQHSYQYSGGGAWHYDDDPMTPAKERTWSQWRGYGTVTHLTGPSGGTRTKTVTVYLRGMNGDRVLGPDGRTPDADARRTVKVSGIKAAEVTDSDQYAGFSRETVSYDGTAEVSGTINDPWSKRTSTQHKSYADTEAYFVRIGASHARTVVTSKLQPSDRVRTTATTYDDYGMPVTVEDRGDDSVTGDEKCTRTWYARNDTVGLNSLVSRTRTVAKACSVTDANLDLPADSTRPGDVVSDAATAFDTKTWSATQKPTKGEAQWAGRAKAYGTDDAPAWQQTATTDFDTLGRPAILRNARNTITSRTVYTPPAAGPLTSTTVYNAKDHASTTVRDFALGTDLSVTDANGRKTETEYDSLGRSTKVWLPNRSKALGKTPNYVYTYSITSSALPYVASASLNGDGSAYNTTYEIYDSLLRTRQVQAPSAAGGRLIAQTLYDGRGNAVTAESDIWDEKTAPSGKIVEIDGSQPPQQTDTVFDGAGRAIKTITKNYGVTRWSTDTVYLGDTVTTSAPAGGQANAVVTDALGRTVERRDYAGPKPTGTDLTTTRYTFDPAGHQQTLVAPDKSTWTYTYDLFGRQFTVDDPDKGRTTTYSNDLDQADKSVDSHGRTLLFEYDVLGRKTGMWQTSKTDGDKLAVWTFDELAKGQQDTAVRYVGGATGKTYTQKVTGYDPLYKVTKNQLTLPTDDPMVTAGVPSTLSFSTGYNLDGTVKQAAAPAVGGLAAETVSYTYDGLGQVLTAKGSTGYLQDVAYSPLGDARRLTLATDATSAKKVYLNQDYEAGTRRLTRSYVTDDVHGFMLQELKFAQDDAGNVTSIFDGTTLGGAGQADYQCYTYDGHRRLTESWTPKTADCAASGRTTANLGGAAPYWTTYGYKDSGLRDTQVEHTATGNTTTSYVYGTTRGQPHALARTETAGRTSGYDYDATGNTISRPGTQAAQTVVWDAESRVTSVSEPAAGTKPATRTGYLYDAGGELLIRRADTTDGESVLYLGTTEVRLKTSGGGAAKALSGARYYKAGDKTFAVRTATSGVTGTKLTFLAGDDHGTSALAVDSGTLAYVKRYTTPFGAARGAAATTWPDDKGFLGKPADTTTGLTHLGAREYDPATGRFLSVDPLLEPEKAQSLNGYSYASNNPATVSDPTGMSDGLGGIIGGIIGAIVDAVTAVVGILGAIMGGGGGNGGGLGTAPTSNLGNTSSNNLWTPGSTYNFITKSWDTPFMNRGNETMDDWLAGIKDYGVVSDDKAANRWDTSRGLFFGWLWGGGYPLREHQDFRGGDAFTSILATDSKFSEWRNRLVGQARDKGMQAKYAKETAEFSFKDKGPEPNSPWYKFNSIRGAVSDVAGVLTNGGIGTDNSADAFLGSYSATGRIKSLNKKEGTVTLKFTATNKSDWNSATHVIPRSWNPAFEDTFGAAVTEDFSWEEKWPVNECVNYSDWLG
ncbi:RHS repeat-associated core domain-containing protein [Streptomyces sp. NBC_01485]|uniref:RHS repeat-associated core domain-containing protein n=1 Tax=Streptomyces sp. NBC_01485 TaxID=2903884 RepID=UPI002E36804E|nr:RHS repeat-associated core domain-containing protein [Streptomyces sp. NBC_01485]